MNAQQKLVFLPATLLLAVSPAFADTIHKTDGTLLESVTIVSESLTEVVYNYNDRSLTVSWTSNSGETFNFQVSTDGITWTNAVNDLSADPVATETSYTYQPPPGRTRALVRVERN